MNIDETAVWLDGLFPGEMRLHQANYEAPFPTVLATFSVGDEVACSTVGFSDVDTGVMTDGKDARCEFFTVTHASDVAAMHVVDVVAQTVVQANGALPGHPGTLIPGIGDIAKLPGNFTVGHGLFVVPYVWDDEVPRLVEENQITLMLQLLMLTEEEFHYAVTYGVVDLLDEMARTGVDALDWAR